jgi:hypothetical protein
LPDEQRNLGLELGSFGAQSIAMLPGAFLGGEAYVNRAAIAQRFSSLANRISFQPTPQLALATAGDARVPITPTTVDPASITLDAARNEMASASQTVARTGDLPPPPSVESPPPALESPPLDAARPGWDRGVPLRDLAEPATGKGDSWVQIYRESFPPEESDSVYSIRQRIADGDSYLYETRGTDGRVITFSLFDRVGTAMVDGEERPVFLNSYNATRSGMRGLGVGTKHMAAALDRLLAEHPGAIVPFEIDHTGLVRLPDLSTLRSSLQSGDYAPLGETNPAVELTPEQQHTNLIRLKFYERLAERTGPPARVADVDYQMPNLEDESAPPLPAHLLYFGSQPLSDEAVANVVRTIYTSPGGYELDPADPLIQRVLDTVGKTGVADKLNK